MGPWRSLRFAVMDLRTRSLRRLLSWLSFRSRFPDRNCSSLRVHRHVTAGLGSRAGYKLSARNDSYREVERALVVECERIAVMFIVAHLLHYNCSCSRCHDHTCNKEYPLQNESQERLSPSVATWLKYGELKAPVTESEHRAPDGELPLAS